MAKDCLLRYKRNGRSGTARTRWTCAMRSPLSVQEPGRRYTDQPIIGLTWKPDGMDGGEVALSNKGAHPLPFARVELVFAALKPFPELNIGVGMDLYEAWSRLKSHGRYLLQTEGEID
jgi:hypothetical protein